MQCQHSALRIIEFQKAPENLDEYKQIWLLMSSESICLIVVVELASLDGIRLQLAVDRVGCVAEGAKGLRCQWTISCMLVWSAASLVGRPPSCGSEAAGRLQVGFSPLKPSDTLF